MNMSKKDGLIAREKSEVEITRQLGTDSLHYLTPERYEEAVGLTGKLCIACVTGNYPEQVAEGHN